MKTKETVAQFKFRNTKTGTVLELDTAEVAEMNVVMIRAWASKLHSHAGCSQPDLENDFGIWETAEARKDSGYEGVHEVPVPHCTDDVFYSDKLRHLVEKYVPNLDTGHWGRLVVSADECRNRILPENDNVYMTNGQRRRANKAVYELCQVIGVWETVQGGARYRD